MQGRCEGKTEQSDQTGTSLCTVDLVLRTLRADVCFSFSLRGIHVQLRARARVRPWLAWPPP
jgi:hypothetical protein